MARVKQQQIAITRPDGGVSFMGFVTQEFVSDEGAGWTRDPTPENIEHEMTRGGIAWTSWRLINDTDIPADRTFRNAVVDVGGSIKHDMPKARNIWRDKMRVARAVKLTALDAAYMKADEHGDIVGKRRIAEQRQALRDVTAIPEIEAATTPDALKAVWPAILE